MSLPISLVMGLQLAITSPAPTPAAVLAAPQTQPTVHHALLGEVEVNMPAPQRADVVVDGHLDEPMWHSAQLPTGFSLYQPTDPRPSPDSTDVLVWYSPDAIYFGARACEPHGIVRATLADRDRVSSDDNIEIHLDTFEERRRAFVFIVNAPGVQADGTKSEGGGFIPGSNVAPGQSDLSPDCQWQSRGHVESWGYEVEIRIPFGSLRFPSKSTQRWGIQFSRNVQHSGYQETWTPVKRSSARSVVPFLSKVPISSTSGTRSSTRDGSCNRMRPSSSPDDLAVRTSRCFPRSRLRPPVHQRTNHSSTFCD